MSQIKSYYYYYDLIIITIQSLSSPGNADVKHASNCRLILTRTKPRVQIRIHNRNKTRTFKGFLGEFFKNILVHSNLEISKQNFQKN